MAIPSMMMCKYYPYWILSDKHYLFSGNWGAFGCDGAWPQAYYDWIVNENGGRLEQESCAPYHAADRSCNDDNSCDYKGAHLTGFYNKWYTNEEEMKEIVYNGPVATTVYVSVQQSLKTHFLTNIVGIILWRLWWWHL